MGTGGEQYSEFIKADLAAERERRKYLDERGTSIVTTTSGLATAVFAIGALVTGVEGYEPDRLTTVALLAGLGLFVFAAFCGLAASRTIPYVVAHSDVYNDMVVDHWTDTEEVASQNVAYRNQRTLVSLREANNKKAWWLPVAFWAQVAAALALLIAVGNALACA